MVRRRKFRRLRFEQLERRSLLATFEVNVDSEFGDPDLTDDICDSNLNLDGPQCSFTAAIANANAKSGRDTVTFRGVTRVVAPSFAIRDAVTIDGGGAVEVVNSLFLSGPASTVMSIAVGGFVLEGEGGHVLESVKVGTDIQGLAESRSAGVTITSDRNEIHNSLLRNTSFSLVIDGGHNTVTNTQVGVDATGKTAFADNEGVVINGDNNTLDFVVIAGSRNHGVVIAGNNNTIKKSAIGLDRSLESAIPNRDFGVDVRGNDNHIGIAGNGNHIAGNANGGIRVQGNRNTIADNFIGVNGGTKAAVPNGVGISVLSGSRHMILGNVISGNRGSGLSIDGDHHTVSGNWIGTNENETADIGNGGIGLRVSGNDHTIGGTANNVIVGNKQGGIELWGQDNTLTANFIGATRAEVPLPNGNFGVRIFGSSNLLGGTEPRDANTIAFNPRGVVVNSGTANRILANRIFGMGVEGGAAIELSGGANHSQPAPVLKTVGSDVQGELSIPDGTALPATYRIEVFSVPRYPESRQAEAQTFLDTADVVADSLGTLSFTVNVSVPAEQFATATATNLQTRDTSPLADMVISPIRNPFVVNDGGDAPDADLNDGIADSDLITAGEQTTLRAAIEQANHNSGSDSITFSVNLVEVT